MRKLSTIEMSVLGLAWLRGPCSTYAIMKELSLSESSYYKSRAGTTYTVVKRLVGFGLLGAEDEAIRITDQGEEALRDWVTPPIPGPDLAHSADLVRLRFFFLGALPPEDRLRFVDECRSGLIAFLKRAEELVAENERIGDYYGALATLSVVFETRARIQWLTAVRKWVENPIRAGSWTETLLDAARERDKLSS